MLLLWFVKIVTFEVKPPAKVYFYFSIITDRWFLDVTGKRRGTNTGTGAMAIAIGGNRMKLTEIES